MTLETYDDLKQYVGSKDNFTDDLLNIGYSKGRKDGYNQALDDFVENISLPMTEEQIGEIVEKLKR